MRGSAGRVWYHCWNSRGSSSVNMNRRMRSRMYGGVRGRREWSRLLLDPIALRVIYSGVSSSTITVTMTSRLLESWWTAYMSYFWVVRVIHPVRDNIGMDNLRSDSAGRYCCFASSFYPPQRFNHISCVLEVTVLILENTACATHSASIVPLLSPIGRITKQDCELK